jgi:O-antigen ligase
MREMHSTLGRPMLMLGATLYFAGLALALIWLHLSPEIVLALTVGAIALVVLTIRPIMAVHVFMMLMFAENSIANEGGVTIMKLVGALVLSAWLLSIAVKRRLNIHFDKSVLVMMLFLAWCGISLVNAYDGEAALSRTLTFAQLALAAIMFSSLVDTEGKLRGIFYGIVFWTCVSTLIAVGEYYAGFTHVAEGLSENRNGLAIQIDVAIVAACFLLQMAPSIVSRLAVGATLPIFFLGVALTLSRGGLVTLFVALALVWYRVARQHGVITLVASVTLLVAITVVLPESFWNRAGTIVPAIERQEDTFGLRVRLWKIGLHMIVDRPVVGVGPGNFIVASPRYGGGATAHRGLGPHSSYVGMAAETGLVGLGLFLLLHVQALVGLVRRSRRARRAGLPGLDSLASATGISLIVLMVAGLSGHWYYSKYLWLLLGLSSAVRYLDSPKTRPLRVQLDSHTRPSLASHQAPDAGAIGATQL